MVELDYIKLCTPECSKMHILNRPGKIICTLEHDRKKIKTKTIGLCRMTYTHMAWHLQEMMRYIRRLIPEVRSCTGWC